MFTYRCETRMVIAQFSNRLVRRFTGFAHIVATPLPVAKRPLTFRSHTGGHGASRIFPYDATPSSVQTQLSSQKSLPPLALATVRRTESPHSHCGRGSVAECCPSSRVLLRRTGQRGGTPGNRVRNIAELSGNMNHLSCFRSTRRCFERGFLEFTTLSRSPQEDPATTDNIQLRCRGHNGYEATLFFGPLLSVEKLWLLGSDRAGGSIIREDIQVPHAPV